MTEEACTWSKHCAYFRSIAACAGGELGIVALSGVFFC